MSKLRTNVKATAASAARGAGLSRRRVVERAVVDELTSMLDSSAYGGSGKPLPDPKKGRTHVVMFVGLQGAGKTTTCSKYAAFYKRKGLKPALVCADTFRAGAFDQLKQNASKTGIPFYGSYTETDPAKIAEAGVAKFKEEGRDLIIVDTSGRHKQEEALFEEMRQVSAAARPDATIFVMDGSIGQAAQEQARAFRDAVDVGAVILTKMDGGARGKEDCLFLVCFFGGGKKVEIEREFQKLMNLEKKKLSLSRSLQAAAPSPPSRRRRLPSLSWERESTWTRSSASTRRPSSGGSSAGGTGKGNRVFFSLFEREREKRERKKTQISRENKIKKTKQVRRPHGRGRPRRQGPGGPHGRDLQGPLHAPDDARPAGQPAEARAGEL